MQKICSRGHVFEKSSAFPVCPFCLPGRYKKNASKKQFTFCAEVWLYSSAQAAWHFLTIPEKLSVSIKEEFGAKAKGWGSISVEVTVGNTSWKTSIFPDRKRNAYILPLKASVRKKENIAEGDEIKVSLEIVSTN